MAVLEKPSEFTDWASDETQVTEPSGGLKSTGWSPGDRPPAEYWNWLHKSHDDWAKWLDQETFALRRGVVANALQNYTTVNDILSSAHNWHAGAVSNTGASGLVDVRYWVVGDDNAGNTAIAYAQGPNVAGSGWADETGSAQAGSLDRCAAAGTLCLGVERATGVWKLGGATNENGTGISGGATFNGIAHDPTNNLWVAATSAGVFTSPMTGITWTLRQAATNTLCIGYYGGRLLAVHQGGIHYSTDGITWTAGYVDASANWSNPNAIAANKLGFWIVDAAVAPRIFYTADGQSITEYTAVPSLSDERIFAWGELICVPGVYLTYDPRLNQWAGAAFTHGVNERIGTSPHGGISCNGTENAILFGPTVDLTDVAFAV